jgi:hypothetical protein
LFELRDWRPAHRGCQRVIPIIGRTVRPTPAPAPGA